MTGQTTEENSAIAVSFGRLPVFNERRQLWGYELFCISDKGELETSLSEDECVASNLASSTYIALQQLLDRGKRIIVNFTQKHILENFPYALPPERAAIKLTNLQNVDDSVLNSIAQLKADGYQIIGVWFPGFDNSHPIFQMVDIVCLDVQDRSRDELITAIEAIKPYTTTLLANRVNEQSLFDVCMGLGFTLFQGSFFKQPEEISVKKITSNQATRFQLLKVIEQEDPDFSELAKTLQMDVAISFRLLSYLNSAAFGFRQKIQSIREAITLLGWRKMKNWLRIVILTDVSQNRHASELIFLSAQRGKFLEHIVREHDFWGFEPDSLFLLGMFSLLDAMLNKHMTEIVKYLPLSDKLKEALCGNKNNEFVPLIQLAECLEEAKWEESDTMIQQLGLDSVKVKSAFQQSIEWAHSLSDLHAVGGQS